MQVLLLNGPLSRIKFIEKSYLVDQAEMDNYYLSRLHLTLEHWNLFQRWFLMFAKFL